MNYDNWYSIQVAAGCEKKVQLDLQKRKTVFEDTFIQNIEVPQKTELIFQKSGKKKSVKTLLLPGYVLVQVALEEIEDEEENRTYEFPQTTHDLIRSTPNVLGFAGPDKKRPRLMSEKEVQNIFSLVDQTHSEVKSNVLCEYYEGDTIEVISGPFTGKSAVIVSISGDKLVTYVNLFSKETRTELTKDQVKK
jgi:transcription termination/antitermination protein NusG